MAGTFELLSTPDDAVTIRVALPTGGVTAGEVLTPGSDSIHGFVLATVNETTITNSLDPVHYTLVTKARRVEVNKDGNAINVLDLVYWTGTAVTASPTGNTLIGYALESVGASVTKVKIYFDGWAVAH